MEELASNKDKLILKKFILAENERDYKRKIKQELRHQKQETTEKIIKSTKKQLDLQDQLHEEYTKNKQRQLLNSINKQASKLHDNIILHRKVISQLIEQESKFIRKPPKLLKKINKLPYLQQARQNLKNSVKLSEGEEEEVEFSIYNFLSPSNMNKIKVLSLTPSPVKAKKKIVY